MTESNPPPNQPDVLPLKRDILPPPRRRPRGKASLIVLTIHGVLYCVVAYVLGIINYLSAPGHWWFLWPLWILSIFLTAHIAIIVTRRFWFGAHLALWLVGGFGLFMIDLIFSGLTWFYWPVGIVGVLLLGHAGLALSDTPKELLITPETSDSGRYPSPLLETAPSTMGRFGRTVVRIVSVCLVGFTLFTIGGGVAVGFVQGLEIQGSGNVVTESREISPFTGIQIDGQSNVTIRQGAAESVVVRTDSNLQDLVTTEVQDSVLRLGTTTSWWRQIDHSDLEYEITTRDLNSIRINGHSSVDVIGLTTDTLNVEFNGFGHLDFQGLTVRELSVKISGAGEIVLDGTVTRQQVDVAGAGHYDAAQLQSVQTTAAIHGAGEITVWVTTHLDASVSGVGHIGYYGDPTVPVGNVSGVGSIDRLGPLPPPADPSLPREPGANPIPPLS